MPEHDLETCIRDIIDATGKTLRYSQGKAWLEPERGSLIFDAVVGNPGINGEATEMFRKNLGLVLPASGGD